MAETVQNVVAWRSLKDSTLAAKAQGSKAVERGHCDQTMVLGEEPDRTRERNSSASPPRRHEQTRKKKTREEKRRRDENGCGCGAVPRASSAHTPPKQSPSGSDTTTPLSLQTRGAHRGTRPTMAHLYLLSFFDLKLAAEKIKDK